MASEMNSHELANRLAKAKSYTGSKLGFRIKSMDDSFPFGGSYDNEVTLISVETRDKLIATLRKIPNE